MTRPTTATMRGATTSESQKFFVRPSRKKPKYAPSMYSEPCAKFTTVMSPKMSDRPTASSTRIMPSTSPVNSCAASAASVRSAIDLLGEPLLGAGAIQLLVGGDTPDGFHQAPLALHLARLAAAHDPQVL